MLSTFRAWLASPYATAIIAVLGAAALAWQEWPRIGHSPRPAASTSRPAAPARLAPPAYLLQALRDPDVGEVLAGWTVEAVRGIEDDGLSLDVHREETRLTISIVPKGSWEHRPPATAGEHDIFYATPRSGEVEREELLTLLDELTERLKDSAGSQGAAGDVQE